MSWQKAHGQEGGPGKLLSKRGADALRCLCPECGAKPGERCVRQSDYGSSWTGRPDLGRRFFELRPSQSHRGRGPLTPTLDWKGVALRLARAIQEGDEWEMRDAAKDAFLFSPMFPGHHVKAGSRCQTCCHDKSPEAVHCGCCPQFKPKVNE